MGDYKQLNKELIDANRELKQTIATYQNELVLLRAEIMEQQRLRVEQQQEWRERVISMLSHNFVTTLHDIDANVNIAEILGYCNLPSIAVGVSGKSDSSGQSRSSQLVREFRRSSIICRQNNVRMSPTRRPQDDNAIAEQTEYSKLDETSGSDMDLDNSVDGVGNIIDVENDENEENEELHCIREANEEEEEEEEGEDDDDDDRNTATLVEKHKRKPIRDLTNIVSNEIGEKGHFVTKRGKQRDLRNDKEDSIQAVRDVGHDYRQSIYHPCDIEVENDLVNTIRNTLYFSHNDYDESVTNIAELNKLNSEDKDQIKKRVVVRVQRLHEPPQPVQHFQTTKQTTTPKKYENANDSKRIDDLSLGITQFSMGNFLEASCSTPCHNEKPTSADGMTENKTNATTLSTTASQTQEINQSMRPQRRCAPKNLVEPNLISKQRSEFGKRRGKKLK
ncbi:uncharacterized protein LOC101452223 [Ceratitis capitata]|uniref:uncharacterized protein LOC101452223 n=1 Tax=Ceratitis capitata TaxID=7213 RepID=UPI00032A1633|nr:uncharacterized protein LOC101452223 [Ceratitis capitata]XP_020713539.1 uncharacterized protein LOC101452223 [Ceratitis capitata]